MTIQSAESTLQAPGLGQGSAMGGVFAVWRENVELLLAAITLVALLVGWLGGNLLGWLPGWAVATAAVIAFVAGGYSGVMGAIEEARHGKLDIDFLMVTAALGAALIGQWAEGALLLFLFTLSGALEEFAMARTRKAIEALAQLRPDVATVRRDGAEITLGVDALVVGDVVVVRPGERLPVDGTVVKGMTTVDQSPITGESVPVQKEPGDQVFAGTINGGGALDVEVTKLASESTLSKIIKLVSEAQEDATPTQQFIDRFSPRYTYVVLGMTLLAIVVPWLFINEPFSQTLYRAMTLMVVASPCALIISTPASVLSAIAAGARGGVLFKGGAYLEKIAQVTMVAFDKTGTLTHGKPVVTNVHPLTGHTRADLLRLAGSAELLSEHHIGRAVVEQARSEGIELETPADFNTVAGHGLQAQFDRGDHMETIYIGNDRFFMNENLDISPAVRTIGDALKKQGKTSMLVVRRSTMEDTLGSVRDWEVVGYLAVADTVRPEARAAVQRLREEGVERVVMLTGDNKAVAQAIAAEVGITDVYAELLPEQKVELVQTLVGEGKVAMVGDGVNDAPALTQANVGFAIGAGTDVAMESADVVLMKSDPYDIVAAIELSRATLRKMHQNLWWAVGYNVIAFPLAAGVLYPFVLSPEVAALSMSGSTLIVAINALMLKRTKLAGIRQPGKNAAPVAAGGPATPEPAKVPAVPANPHPIKKAVAS